MAEEASKIDRSKYGEEAYKAAGSPMFGKLWSYQELETVERPASLLGRSRGRKCVQRDFKRPDNWPADTEVEPKTWVSWLPEGWAQGIRTQALSGKKLSCYMNPQGKRYWHKKDIEKVLGYMLNPKPVEEEEPEEEKTKKIRYVTDPDAIPNWPDDEDDWLPRDWKLAFRQLPSGLHRIFVPPGKEDEGFLYHRTTVLQWLSGETSNVSLFGTSKPMAEISAAAAEREGSTAKKKRRRGGEPKVAEPKDFEEVSGLSVVRLEGADHLDALRQANVQGAEKLAADAQRLREILSSRHLEDTSLIYVFQSGEQHPVSIAIVGFYYKRPAAWNDRDAYQKILLAPETSALAACSGLHICWSLSWEGHWKIGSLGSDLLGRGYAAICQDSSMQTGWKLLRADLLQGSEPAKAARTSE